MRHDLPWMQRRAQMCDSRELKDIQTLKIKEMLLSLRSSLSAHNCSDINITVRLSSHSG